ncbi:VanZ family protein [Metabacillus niabensis]|uniref:VanZ family protein n=1 Tax=Metabacillus niabensis TaxID=324854 RepID=UPI001CFBD05A|nr:VanZ family protein [Metabacillus niabensis]
MKKYLLIIFPILFFGESLFFYYSNVNYYFPIILQVMVNITITTVCMIFLLKHTKIKNVFDWILGICFSLYFCILYHNTIESLFFFEGLRYSLENIGYIYYSVNFIPIKGIIDVIRYNPSAVFQVVGNIIMLTPFTFSMLYFKWANCYKQAIWYTILCTIGIEFIQFLQTVLALVFNLGIGRSADIDDVILNTLGAFIGIGCYSIWVIIDKRFKSWGEIRVGI